MNDVHVSDYNLQIFSIPIRPLYQCKLNFLHWSIYIKHFDFTGNKWQPLSKSNPVFCVLNIIEYWM